MRILSQNQSDSTLRRVFFILLDAATGAVRQTGQAGNLAGYLSKKGVAGIALIGSFAEVDAANKPGLYYYQATAAELDTLGRLVFTFTCANCLTRTVVTHVGKTNENIVGADGDSLKTLSDQLDPTALEATAQAIKAKTDTLPTGAQIDTQLSGTHGAGSWGAKSAGTSPVTITVKDADSGVVLAGVVVHIRNADGTLVYDWGLTDENGQIGFLLDDGSYKVWCSKVSAYSFTNPTSLTVSGVTTLLIQGSRFSPSVPPSPSTCVVFGWVFDEASSPKVATVTAEIVASKKFLVTNPQVIRGPISTQSRISDGLWELVLTRSDQYTETGVTYKFTVGDIQMGDFQVPAQASIAFKTLFSS